MPFAFARLYRRLGAGYFWLFAVFEVVSASVICLATVGLFHLYEPMSVEQFWRVTLFSEAWVLIALGYTFVKSKKLARSLIDWVRAGRPADGAAEAWRTAVSFPRRFVEYTGLVPFLLVALPVAVYFTIEFELPLYSVGIIFGGTTVAVAYSAILHFFAAEAFLRPILADIGQRLPEEFGAPPEGVPLRWKLLGALPLINVITGVVVSGLSQDATASINDLGIDVVVAVIVAFTISLELTVLVTRSVLKPVDDLLEATERVKSGDLDARVPLTSGDELGTLAGSFNEMMDGLSEREALRGALGSYVDPAVAERVLDEGELLEGDEVEVTVMIVDVRDFTPFAERSSARETVTFLNEFFELVVPIVLRYRGNANKFLGDGLLAVFGAPERVRDHADHALDAACEIAREVDRRFGGDIRIGVGLNSGPVVVGSVGGGGRLEFAVIGDPVNVAARVEETTRETGDTILLTEATRCLLERVEVELEPRGEIALKGKSEPTGIYAVTLDERSARERRPLTAEA
jgi:class 3 adenylate cyclase